MRITVVGHSLIHPRQYLFFDYMNTLPKIEVQQIYPACWGYLKRKNGFAVTNEGNLRKYIFSDDEVSDKIAAFNPDIIYTQAEWWQLQAFKSTYWAELLKVPHVLFCWENLPIDIDVLFVFLSEKILPIEEILPIDIRGNAYKDLLRRQALVVCGNKEAEEIIKFYNKNTIVLPQIGIRSDIFKPLESIEKNYDILFVGREVPEKGIEYVTKLENDGFSILRAKGVDYIDMPMLYNSARVLVVPSLDTPIWSEQWPACIAEAMLCGIPVVAFDAGSIRSNYNDSGITLIKQRNYGDLKEAIHNILSAEQNNANLRNWALERFGHEAVVQKLITNFENILKKD